MLDSVANVKSRLGITGTAYDVFIGAQITLISDVIEAYCRRKFAQATYIQTFYRDENQMSKHLDTFHFPLISVASIEIDGVVYSSANYRLNKPMGRVISTEDYFFAGEETVIEYDAGFATIPSAILAVLDSLVGERYNKKSSGVDLNFGSDVQRISIPGAISIDFDYSLSNNDRKSAYGSILGNNANILDDWRSDRAVLGSDKLIYVEEQP